MFDKASEVISARNKNELIWGFMPGGYQAIDALVHMTGAVKGFSYAFGAFLLALVVRLIVFPVHTKDHHALAHDVPACSAHKGSEREVRQRRSTDAD